MPASARALRPDPGPRRTPVATLRRAAVLLLLASNTPAPASPAPAPDRLVMAINWLPQAEYGGFYEALADGTYRRFGLDVTLQPGGAQINPPQLLANGAVDAALGDTPVALHLVRQQVPIVAVAAFLQHEPGILIAHAGQQIRTPADLRGRPAMVSQMMLITAWPLLEKRWGLSRDQIRPYSESYTPFLLDQRAFRQGFLTYDPAALAARGIPTTNLLLSDFGYDPYGDLLLVRADYLSAHRDVLARFVAATAIGWKRFLHGDPAPAERLIEHDNPGYAPRTFAEARATLLRAHLVETPDTDSMGIGAMTEARWHSFFAAMSDAGVYPPGLDWRRAFSLDLLRSSDRDR